MSSMRKHSASSTSTGPSTPPPHDIYSVLVAEENRYIRKGYGLITASILAFTFFYFMPVLGNYIWPKVLGAADAYNLEKW